MFGALKKKFSSWLKKPDDSKDLDSKKKSKKEKKKPSKAKKEPTDEELKDEVNKIKEIPLQKKYKVAEHKYEPDLEELKEIQEEDEDKPSFFSKLVKKISASTLTQSDFDELFEEFSLILLENNVALEAVDKIKESLSKDLVNISIKKGQIESTILQSLKDSILEILIEPPDLIKEIQKSKEPYIILFFGINGSGKTTSIAKLAHLLKKKKISSILAAGDTFRAASIEQLQKHGSDLNIKVISQQYGSDPAAVAFDAISYAKKNKIQVVLIDTAGRMYTKINLLKEMEKIVRVSKPNLKIFVAESITGNDAVEQAKTFNESIGIDGIILTKTDVDEKAGTILSVSQVTSKPIYFLGTGQEHKDLETFKKSTVLKNLGLE